MLKPNSINFGNRQISTPTKSIPLKDQQKMSAQLITSTRGPPIPNLVQIHPLRASGKYVKYNKKNYFYLYLFRQVCAQVMDLYARQLKRREITQGCAFWGSERFPLNFGGKPPKLKFWERE